MRCVGCKVERAEALSAYGLRDEQEKYFNSMKTRMMADRQHNWPELAKSGRRFIEFVGLILISHVKHIWQQSPTLRQAFPNMTAMLEKMKPIRCLEHKGREKVITPFVGKQLVICKEFGLDVPKHCSPAFIPVQKRKHSKIGLSKYEYKSRQNPEKNADQSQVQHRRRNIRTITKRCAGQTETDAPLYLF